MSLIKPGSIEEAIIVLLRDGEKKATMLISELRLFKKNITKQGVYAALRKLKAEEAVVMYKGIIAMNTAWMRDMRIIIEHMQNAYEKNIGGFDFLALENKESVQYSFSNTLHLDAFWGHVQSLLVHATPHSEPVFAYNPHYWFYIARNTTERKLLDDFIDHRRQFLMTVGSNTKVDQAIRRDFISDYTQYAFKKLFDRSEYYISAIGDYVIEVFLDKNMARSIEDIYANNPTITPVVIDAFKNLLEVRARHRMKISRNTSKANTLRTKLTKNFFVRK